MSLMKSMERETTITYNDDFVARHTLKIASNTSIFDGHSKSLNPPVRRSLEETTMDKIYRGFRKNIRTDGFAVSQVVEMITMALINARGQSYGGDSSRLCSSDDGVSSSSSSSTTSSNSTMGRSNDKADGNHDNHDIHHRYKLHNVRFHPVECTWDGTVKFSVPVVEKKIAAAATTNDVRNRRLLKGEFPLHVACSVVVNIPRQEDANDHTAREEMSSLSIQHYSVDVCMAATKDTFKSMDKVVLSAISETLDRIVCDISKEFIMAKLPLFPGNQKGLVFRSIYQLNAKLKSGSFSTVYAATHRSSGERCAVKYTNRNKLCPQDDVGILSELYLLSSFNHAGICSVQDFFMEDGCYYVVMPLMEGGDVFDSIGRLKSYDESVARNLVRDLLKALEYLHGKDVVHCDLKSKNLLLRRKDDPSSVVLGDFGFATRVYFPKSLTRQCGTPYFVAPEVLLGNGYDTKADMWSLGVIVYSLLSGDLPFTGRTHLELFKKILGGKVDLEGEAWRDISDVAKDLIQKLLVVDPCSRYSAVDALEHGWIRTDARILRRHSLLNTSARLKTFNARLRLKSAMLAIRSVIIWKNLVFNVKNAS